MSENLEWYVSVPVSVDEILATIRDRDNLLGPNPYPSKWFETKEDAVAYGFSTGLSTGKVCQVYHRNDAPNSAYSKVRNILKKNKEQYDE